MYTPAERDALYQKIETFLYHTDHIEGLLQIGSCALGYRDIYSDIDLMAGIFHAHDVPQVKESLIHFFHNQNACYIQHRQWTPAVLGLSAFWENGLSIDISFMPTAELPIRSNQWRIAFAKTAHFSEAVERSARDLTIHPRIPAIDDDFHHAFLREMRYAEIALCRNDLIQADFALSNARRQLLTMEIIIEGKKLHEFKAYNTLDDHFLRKMEATYPAARTNEAYRACFHSLLHGYQDTLTLHDMPHPDNCHLSLICRFLT